MRSVAQTINENTGISAGMLISSTQSVSSTRCFWGYTSTFLPALFMCSDTLCEVITAERHEITVIPKDLMNYLPEVSSLATVTLKNSETLLNRIFPHSASFIIYFQQSNQQLVLRARIKSIKHTQIQIKLSIWLPNKIHIHIS